LAGRLFRLLENATDRFPDDPEIWFKLGDARFHFGFLHSSTQTQAATREAFDRAVALDSAFAPSYIHLVQVLNQLQDVDAMRAAMRAFLALEPGGEQAAGLRLATTLLDPATARDDSSLGRLFQSADMRARGTAYGTLLFLNDTAETQVVVARLMLRGLSSGHVPAPMMQQARAAAAQGLLARGHLREALSVAPNVSMHVQAGLVGVIPPDSVDRKLAQPRTDEDDDPTRPSLLWYLLRNDSASARTLIERLRDGRAGVFPHALAPGLLALARGDTTLAIRLLTLPDSVCLTWCSFARMQLAQLHTARGDDAAAARIYDQDYYGIGVPKVMWMLHRGRVNQRLGRREKAIDAYAFVVAAWQRADAELQPYVEEARRGLTALRSDPGRR